MIKIIDNILTKKECFNLINLAKNDLSPATVVKDNQDAIIANDRVAQGVWIHEENPLILKIKNIVAEETNLPIENQEIPHIVKYDVEGRYDYHYDFFRPNESYYQKVIKQGGQRIFSCLIYLNDNFEGGETDFSKRNITINPKLGTMVVWKNTKKDNSPDYDSLHAGLPVTSGEKFICIIWVRENKFNLDIEETDIEIDDYQQHFDLGKILNEKKCNFLSRKILNYIKENKFSLETDTRYYNGSLGGEIPEAWILLKKYLPLVKQKIKKEIIIANPYIRFYKNGSTLNKHTDRDGLDWTISLCLFSNLDHDWPLMVKDENGDITNYPTKIGHASLVPGYVLEHWREPLECDEGEFVIQIFLHYTEIN